MNKEQACQNSEDDATIIGATNVPSGVCLPVNFSAHILEAVRNYNDGDEDEDNFSNNMERSKYYLDSEKLSSRFDFPQGLWKIV